MKRIVAIRDFINNNEIIKKGTLGGFVETESNLNDNAWVCGNAKVCNTTDYSVYKNNWSSERYFTYTKSNGMWSVGCFYGTGEQLINKAYEDDKIKGKCYEDVVKLQ